MGGTAFCCWLCTARRLDIQGSRLGYLHRCSCTTSNCSVSKPDHWWCPQANRIQTCLFPHELHRPLPNIVLRPIPVTDPSGKSPLHIHRPRCYCCSVDRQRSFTYREYASHSNRCQGWPRSDPSINITADGLLCRLHRS